MAVRPVKASGIAGVTPAQKEEIMKLFPRRGTGEILRDYEQGIVQGGRSDLVPGGFLPPIPNYVPSEQADTAGQLLLQNLGNLGIDALNVGREASGILLAAPFAAADIFNAPTDAGYMRSLDDFAQGILDMETQKAAQAAKAARMASGIGRRPASMTGVAGGPTYAQTPTDADQDSAIRSQIEDARAISDESGSVSFTGDVGPGSLVAGNIFEPEPNREPMGGTLFGDPVETTPAQDQETAGILTKLIQDSATRGGAEKESSTTVQGDVTDITDQPDDLVETDPRFGAETAPTTRSFTLPDEETTEQKKGSLYEGLLKQSLDSYKTLLGQAPSGAKTMEEYKKEFSDATGIDITGQPDNSAALTAFGLALMQNKAGKGFDVGELLSETGKAGEKALPLMAQARKEAREAQIAAGQYALGASKEDEAARIKALDEATKYLVGRRDAIMTKMVDRRDQLADQAAKRQHDREMKAIEMGFKNQIEATKARATAAKEAREGKKIESQYNREPEYTRLKIRLGFTDNGSREIFANPRMDGADIANAYVKAQRSQEAMGRLDKLLTEIETSGMPSGQILFDRGKNILIALGADPDAFYEGKGISPEDEANAILNVLIMENKRFATQETGNGISNQDRQDLAEAFGKPGQLAANPRAARVKLAELRSIFDAPLRSLEQELSNFYTMENMYKDAETFAATTASMDAILAASPYGQIPNQAGDDGIIRFAQGEY